MTLVDRIYRWATSMRITLYMVSYRYLWQHRGLWEYPTIWKNFGEDESRPTENTAFKNIYNESLYTEYSRWWSKYHEAPER